MDNWVSLVRRMNDKEYQVALAQYINECCEQDNRELEEKCKKNPFLKKRVEKLEEKVNKLTNEQFAEALYFALSKQSTRYMDRIIEFNKKWDKEHYKVIYGKFGNK